MTARAVKGSQPVSTASLAWLPRIRSSSTRNGPRTNQPQAGLAVACASATEESTPPQCSTPATCSSLFSPEQFNQAATINPHTSTSPIPTAIAGRPDCHERSYVRKAPRTATSTAMPNSIPAGKDRPGPYRISASRPTRVRGDKQRKADHAYSSHHQLTQGIARPDLHAQDRYGSRKGNSQPGG